MDRMALRTSGISNATVGSSTTVDCENVRVYLRIRPFVHREDHSLLDHASHGRATPIVQPVSGEEGGAAVRVISPRLAIAPSGGTLVASAATALTGEVFSFDAVGSSDVRQDAVFLATAKPITDNCLLGYNGTIFAYGQTGSGKTFTMQGPANEDGSIDYERRGLIPRTFDYLFHRIREEERRSTGSVSYFCKCAYVEIYNECIYDLLVPEGPLCTLREDAKKGVFVEGCREEIIHSPQDAFRLFEHGSRNRHVAETAMNRESSRSHCVFTIFIQSRKHDGQLLDIRESRFNLVDLAGSERQQLSATAGIRLKEAGNINKSLLALSNVINALVDIANGKPRHVHYRDSRLTFLLRDSLGGNAKTLIIAAISPSPLCYAETLSTLRFAQRAKQIKNKAVVNKDIQGNIFELQSEVRRLRNEVLLLKAGQHMGVASASDSSASISGGGSGNGDGHAGGEMGGSEGGERGGDAYFMLRMALQRQTELLAELAQKQQQLETFEEIVRRRDQQITSERMVAKFRENTIRALTSKLAEGQAQSDLLDVFEAERAQYKAEMGELRKQIEHHPDLIKVSYEAMQGRDRLRKLDEFSQNLSKYEDAIAKHRRYEEALAERLLKLEREREESQQQRCSESNSRQSSLEEVPLQSFADSCTPGQSPMAAAKSAAGGDEGSPRSSEGESAGLSQLQRELEQLSIEKREVESRYEDLILEQEILRKELEDLRALSETREPCDSSAEFPTESDLEDLGEFQEEELAVGKRRRRGKSSRESVGGGGPSVAELRSMQESLQCKLYDMEVENAALREQIEQISQEARDEAQAAFDLSQELLALRDQQTVAEREAQSQVAELKNQVDRLTKDMQEGSQRLATSEGRYRETETLLLAARGELARQSARINELETNLTTLEAKLGKLGSALATYEGLTQLGCQSAGAEDVASRLRQDQAMLLEKSRLAQQLELDLQRARGESERLQSELVELQKRADPERLAAAEQMVSSLSGEVEELQEELLKLRRENDKLIQHSNVKQKLQYHLQIKEENNHFREEIRQLREELKRLNQRNIELEEAQTGPVRTSPHRTHHQHHSERK